MNHASLLRRGPWTMGIALIFGSRLAQAAPTVAVANETSLPRLDASGAQLQKRNLTLTPEAVNNLDCLADQRIRFTLLLDGFAANGRVEAWATDAGASCTDVTSRAGVTQTCWPVSPQSIPLQPQVNVDIPVRQILSGAAPFSPQATNFTSTACGQVDFDPISVQFLYFDPANVTAPAATHAVTIAVDTIGPTAPVGIAAKPGDRYIETKFTSASDSNPAFTGISALNVYCEKADAAVATCSAAHLSAPTGTRTIPDATFDATYRCGTLTGASPGVAGTVEATSLTNGTSYAVALATVDQYGNSGPLSEVACATPTATAASDDSGCAMLGAPRARGTVTLVAGLVIGGTLLRRRRRSSRRASSMPPGDVP